MRRTPPPWFDPVRREALEIWELEEENPKVFGPWRQLFSQIQCPRHVISELVQNAEDAGAETVEVYLEGETFVFRHDGHDFTEEEFRSLCRFAYSNKRNLWTIGFRGMGFKSLFSLGPEVEVRTPTLAVRFRKERFTLPHWIEEDRDPPEGTEIRVPIGKPAVREKIERQMERWAGNPLPLLFLRGITVLRVGGVERRAEPLEEGPVAGSRWYRLGGAKERRILRIPLRLGTLPPEALEEIRQERGAVEGLENREIEAVVLLGQEVDRRLFVVLPTPVEHGLPVAIHAPFLLSPSREDLLDVSASETNRWLLERCGQEIGRKFLEWVGDRSLGLDARARAYGLLPTARTRMEAEESGDDVTANLIGGMAAVLEERPIVLGTDGALHRGEEVAALPRELLEVWPPETAIGIFAPGKSRALAAPAARFAPRIAAWSALEVPDDSELLERLEPGETPVPRPGTWEALLTLWRWVASAVGRIVRESRWYWSVRDYQTRLVRLRILPVAGEEELATRNEVFHMPAGKPEALDERDWSLLVRSVNPLDPGWIEFVADRVPEDDAVRQLWETLEIKRARQIRDLWLRAIESCRENGLPDGEWGRLLRIGSTQDLDPGNAGDRLTFRCVDGEVRPAEDELLLDTAGVLERLLPERLFRERVVDDRFLASLDVRSRRHVVEWLLGKKILGFIPQPRSVGGVSIEGRERFAAFLKDHGLSMPNRLPFNYRSRPEEFRVTRVDWPEELWSWWERLDDWPLLGQVILCAWRGALEPNSHDEVLMVGSNGRQIASVDAEIPATWLRKLREKPILRDAEGAPASPLELVWPTEETRTIRGIRTVAEDLATPENREALLALGVAEQPTDPMPLVQRLEALARDGVPIGERVFPLYDQLDGILERRLSKTTADNAVLERLKERLPVPTPEGWRSVADVFLRNPEDIPGVAALVPELVRLRLWSYLGVRERPGPRDAVEWLLGRTGARLEGPELSSARAVLARFPGEAARNGHWLDCTGRFVPIETLQWRASAPPEGLVSWLRSGTADLSMLDPSANLPPNVRSLRPLESALVRVLAEEPLRPAALPPEETGWLGTLGGLLATIERWAAPEADDARLRELRDLGRRLRGLRVRLAETLKVEHRLDGRPVTDPGDVTVFWKEDALYVTAPLGPEIQDAVVEELARSAPPGVRDVVHRIADRSYCRDERWIQEVLRHEGFAFPAEPLPPAPPAAGVARPRPPIPPDPDPVPKPRERRPPGDPLHRQLEAAGFTLDGTEGIWRRSQDGMELWEVSDGPFPWAVRMPGEAGPRPAIVRTGQLSHGRRLVISAEQWDEGPRIGAVLVEADGDRLAILPFRKLRTMVENGSLRLIPERLTLVVPPDKGRGK